MAALLPVASVTVLVLTAAGIWWRARDERWVHDAQLELNAQPRWSLVPVAFLVLGAAASIVLGVVLLASGFTPGWGFFPLAVDAVLIVGFTAWIARHPFPTD